WLNRLARLNARICYRYHRLKGHINTLPEHGAAIVVANHFSGLDPFLLIAASHRPLRFLIAEEEYNRFGLKWLFKAVGCIPVDRRGRPEKAFRAARRALEQGEVIAIFPHGGIRLDSERNRKLKPGAVRLAQMVECPIVPIRIDGIAREGTVFAALMHRSHARLRSYSPIACGERELAECNHQIADYIERMI
ncbi:MAG: 1-acyl-sn-glycerol-3-phosphate acyltransferase, partial [Gammaproteobacteria bacterium]|nr:1-acyl-sn-glycerol-3-phosphate acyltransferase [Gammaproteobacteria bacterium]